MYGAGARHGRLWYPSSLVQREQGEGFSGTFHGTESPGQEVDRRLASAAPHSAFQALRHMAANGSMGMRGFATACKHDVRRSKPAGPSAMTILFIPCAPAEPARCREESPEQETSTAQQRPQAFSWKLEEKVESRLHGRITLAFASCSSRGLSNLHSLPCVVVVVGLPVAQRSRPSGGSSGRPERLRTPAAASRA
ncbi:hypothetical protein BU26DRAFT_506445 [Trematosphaeria pertusa]|uniref:Uncharacterized protein n=1 Tax=Trematosphaeria pertusa TaxID=390896 RepID=A0A6A6IAS1_9PLEO|nr:uncharacterized protein BU26DRAFT_506445 [Trematosphaeria pertusa]KAF2247158.1 hypothetical protein BU26DRAFT_506445 [Trematosphaeria pertusa]